jgi:1,2-dihydroxy-3,5-cyclohexadiene-1,4-dicarboxylate dehydrogenase
MRERGRYGATTHHKTNFTVSTKATIAIATGDPAGIGPEISLKAALDPAVRAVCKPVIVSDARLIERHAAACGINTKLRIVQRIGEANASGDEVNLLDCPQPEAAALGFGGNHAAAGVASLAFARAAIKAALAGEADAVVAAPQNETSIAQAGIAFDGYPSFVARETATDPDGVYLMLCFGQTKIAHATLHRSVRDALAQITRDNVLRTIKAAESALMRLGIATPAIAVGGLNPHAGEGGLFGREEIEIIKPAIADAAALGIKVTGPFGADTMFHMSGIDAFVVMLHDQGHITAKLLAPNATAAMTIGTPILFSSVAHGSAHDIAGKGIASPQAMIEAVLRLSKAGQRAEAQASPRDWSAPSPIGRGVG